MESTSTPFALNNDFAAIPGMVVQASTPLSTRIQRARPAGDVPRDHAPRQ
jgi:hypothetical protein